MRHVPVSFIPLSGLEDRGVLGKRIGAGFLLGSLVNPPQEHVTE